MCQAQSNNSISNLQGTQAYQDLQSPEGQVSQARMASYLQSQQQQQLGGAAKALQGGIQNIGNDAQPPPNIGSIQVPTMNPNSYMQLLSSLRLGS